MRKHYYFRLAKDNIKKNPRMYIPYLITAVLTAGMLYIILSLAVNPDLANMKKGSRSLPIILRFGSIVTMIFAFIFLFYTNSFIMKRRRKEFGLLNILGMEKRHIAKMLLAETAMIIGITLTGGFALGILLDKVLFLSLTKIIGESATLGFHISGFALCMAGIFMAGTFFLIFLNMLRQIHLAKPAELLSGSSAGEKEPKTKILMTVLGLGLIGAGYAISITTTKPLLVFRLLFVAVVCVILGTYLLFTAVSIAFCKLLKKNKKYYYKTSHFTAISGLIYRMKRNAVGLASVCILSTMVLVMVSTTSALMIGLDDALKREMPKDVSLYVTEAGQGDSILAYLTSQVEITNINRDITAYMLFQGEGDHPEPVTPGASDGSNAVSGRVGNYSVILRSDEADQLSLAEDECILYTHSAKYTSSEFTLLGKTFRVKSCSVYESDFDDEADERGFRLSEIVVHSRSTVQEMIREYNRVSGSPVSERETIEFDYAEADKQKAEAEFNAVFAEMPASGDGIRPYFNSRLETGDEMLAVYGGLFFLGIFLGTLFLMETVLIIYYKQITEGYEDQKRFEIMQNVGMSRAEVVCSVRSQILTVFFLPLVTAGVHTGFAFPILRRLLSQMDLSNTKLYIMCVAGSFAAFAVLYTLIYLITARTYYKIVKR